MTQFETIILITQLIVIPLLAVIFKQNQRKIDELETQNKKLIQEVNDLKVELAVLSERIANVLKNFIAHGIGSNSN